MKLPTTFSIDDYSYDFRIKPMNAIDLLAIRTENAMMKNAESAASFYATILSKIEVKCNDNWLSCYQDGVFLPAELSENTDLVMSLIEFFMNSYLKPAFQKSNDSTES